MALFDNLSLMLGGLVTRAVGSSLYDWIRAVSGFLDGVNPAMSQATWFIDPVNGNDSNAGTSVATAIKTDAERQRRMGPWPLWTLTEYHLRYLNDVPATDPINIVGDWGTNTGNIFIHGSATDRTGKTTLATLSADVVTNAAHNTNTPLQITSNGLTTSWTVDGLLNKRCRFTSGANIGAVTWPAFQDGVTPKKAQFQEGQPTQAFTQPPTFPASTTITVGGGDAFVVEDLVALGHIRIDMVGLGTGTANTVYFDSVIMSLFTISGTAAVCTWGCDWANTNGNINFAKAVVLAGNRCRANSKLFLLGTLNIINSYFDDSASGAQIFTGCPTSFAIRVTSWQRAGGKFLGFTSIASGPVRSWTFQSGLGVFNNTAGPGFEVSSACFNSQGELWGVCGAGGTPLFLQEATGLYYTTAAPGHAGMYFVDVTAAPGTCWISYRRASATQTTAPAWDLAASAFTAYRALTPALLQATVAGGGFNGQFFDPPSNAMMGAL